MKRFYILWENNDGCNESVIEAECVADAIFQLPDFEFDIKIAWIQELFYE